MDVNKDILRWVFLIGATPIWFPFLLTLWKDFNNALRLDGGLLGSPPTGRELDAVLKELADEPEVLVSEPIVQASDRRQPRLIAPSRRSTRAAPAARKQPGFRG